MQRTADEFARDFGASFSQQPFRSAPKGLQKQPEGFLAQSFMIWEIPTRVVRLLVPAHSDGSMPFERVAGMLAMLCLALNRRLEDFQVLVLPERLPPQVTERARELVAEGRSIGSDVKLSPSERAVADGIVEGLSNKEIASRLNISVRTVKFHVSSLLAKFDVPDRIALARHVAASRILQSAPAEATPGLVAV
jgi:DNA-binding CsgD family transcriptional regulator